MTHDSFLELRQYNEAQKVSRLWCPFHDHPPLILELRLLLPATLLGFGHQLHPGMTKPG